MGLSSLLFLMIASTTIPSRCIADGDTYDSSGAKTVCGDGAKVAAAAAGTPAPSSGAPTPAPAPAVTQMVVAAGDSGGGVVKCGRGAEPCTIPDLIETIQTFSAYLLKYILLPVAALMVAIAGIWILTGAHTPGNIEKGKKILWDVVYGIVIALSAYVVVKVIFKLLQVKGVTFQ